jgi:beta-glucosidase-like glycosyl hydrolase
MASRPVPTSRPPGAACSFECRAHALHSSSNFPLSTPRDLLTTTIRESWGYQGFIVSDEGAISDIFQGHHYATNGTHAVADAVNAGCDQNDGAVYGSFLGEAVANNYVTEDAISAALTRVLQARFRVGAFDPPANVPWTSLGPDVLSSPGHRQLALEAAQQAIVLLKNENSILPLSAKTLKRVAVVGPAANNTEVRCWSPIFESR